MPSKYNILYVIASLSGAGAELVLANLVKYIDKTRFNVSVCQLSAWGERGQDLKRQGYDVVCINPRLDGHTDYFSSWRLLRLIRQRGIHLIHSHDLHALIDGALCRLQSSKLQLLHTFHYGHYPHLPWKYLAIEALCARMASRLVAVGHVQKENIRRTYKFKRDFITTVWNGVESSGHPDPAADTPFNSMRLDRRLIIGAMSTMTRQKGIPILLEAASQMQDLQNTCRFVIVGGGPMEGDYRALCRQMGLEKFVTFTGWIKGAAASILPQFDIFLQTSLWEAMSMVVLEAMAAERPIIATTVGENTRVLHHGTSALLVSPGDAGQIVRATRALVEQPELRRRLGREARRVFQKKFTVDRMVRRYEDLYQRLLQYSE